MLSNFTRLLGYALLWMLAGFLISFGIVWFFVAGDVVLPYFILGAILGGLAGAIFALLTQRARSGETRWRRLLLRAALSGVGATAVIAAIWLGWADRVLTPFRDVLLLGVLTVGCSLILGGLSSVIDRRV